MSDRLKLAFAEAAKLPKEDERLWRESFAKSADLLSKLATEARDEKARGETEPLDDLLR